MYDHCIIGAGIVGMATAAAILERRPGAGVVVIEKEKSLGFHQTGHNSGVIHSGIYYEPGSLKARFCRAGAAATKRIAQEHNIGFQTCGKLLVATDERELALMAALEDRAAINQITVERLDAVELRRREPAVRGLGALFVPETGIVDYVAITEALAEQVRRAGGEIVTGTAVTGLREESGCVHVESVDRDRVARSVVACAGLQADRVARMAGIETRFQIVPFRGEYFRLPPSRNDIVRHLIYPVPDPELPFLGIHLTRTTDGGVTVGPNAVLGLSREGYRKGSFSRHDVATYVRFPGMWRVARRHARTGLREIRNSVSRRAYLAACRKYCPELTLDDLGAEPAGIRAQAVLRDGTLVHDFLLVETARTLHVCNAPSPAATSALPIAADIAERVLAR
jgi:L-2-hydroxyglutarate oxidase